ncbi:MAG TPA: hypothetical protein PLP69_02965 [Bacteroidales bacterium]|nr:hypothetical protein [Bacteroidales bacterium]
MKTLIKPLLWICIFLSAINLIWLVFSSVLYSDIQGTLTRPPIYLNMIYCGLLFLILNTLLILFTTIHSLKILKRFFIAGILLIILGVISFSGIIIHYACILDVEHDFADGYGIAPEIKTASAIQIIHLLFLLFALIYFVLILKSPENPALSKTVFREQIFVTMNITGIVCSIAGLYVVLHYFSYLNMGIKGSHLLKNYDITPFIFILLPYFFITAGWVIRYIKDRLAGVIDEKQTSDINRSGMIAMLVSLPLLLIIMFKTFLGTPVVSHGIYITGTITILWVPLYLFLVILIFSSSALYSFRNK